MMRAHAAAMMSMFAIAYPVCGQPTTTIITHGFQIGDKGLWVEEMAKEVALGATEGTVYRYSAATGTWDFVFSVNEPDEVIVLIFNWQEESDSNPLLPGENWGYAEGAADALFAALMDPRYGFGRGPSDLTSNRLLHFIGHSRGASVNSEAVRRVALAGIPVDQVTTLDPHPVADLDGDGQGDLDNCILCEADWGDPLPSKWSNVGWSDNYWRADSLDKGLAFCDCDVNGIFLNDAFDVQLCDEVLACIEPPDCVSGDGDLFFTAVIVVLLVPWWSGAARPRREAATVTTSTGPDIKASGEGFRSLSSDHVAAVLAAWAGLRRVARAYAFCYRQ